MQRFYVPFRYALHTLNILPLANPVDIMLEHLNQGVAPEHQKIATVTRFYSANPDFEPVRRQFLAACGWSTPCREAVELIARYSRAIVEVGAGNGTWSMLLANAGIDVKPTDILRENANWGRDFDQHSHRQWVACENLNAERAFRKYGQHRDVLMGWPPRNATYPQTLASQMKTGQLLFFIGEKKNGIMATPEFFTFLEKNFDKLDETVLPHWYGTNDSLTVWRRR